MSLFLVAIVLGLIGEVRRGGTRFSKYFNLSQETRARIRDSVWLENALGKPQLEKNSQDGECTADNSLLGVRLKGALSETAQALRYDLMGSNHRHAPVPTIPLKELDDLQMRDTWDHEHMQGVLLENAKKKRPFVTRKVFGEGWSEQFLWEEVAMKWPILEDVFTLPRKNEQVDSPSQHVFVTEEQTVDAFLLDFQSLHLERRPGANRVTRVRELLTVDFLAQDSEEHHLAGRGHHYHYSTNYRVFEGLVGGSSDANLLSLKKTEGEEQAKGKVASSSSSSLTWRSLSFDDFSGTNVSARLADNGINVSSGVSITPILTFLPHAMALQLRYVEHHTVRVQLTGEAEYYLFPQWALPSLHLFPSTHVCRGQSQLPLYEARAEVREMHFPTSSSVLDQGDVVIKRARLRPGDFLYIPPFWAVHTESKVGMATILDVASPSWEQMALMEAWHMKLPLTDPALYVSNNNKNGPGDGDVHVSEVERIVAAQVYLVHILSRIHSLREAGLRSPRDYVRKLYYSRYAQLYPPSSLFMKPYARVTADDEVERKEKKCPQREKVFTCFMCGEEDRSREQKDAVGKLNSHLLTNRAAFIAACVEDPSVPFAAKQVWLETYMERIASWAMGLSGNRLTNPHEEGLRFLLSCLDLDGFVPVVVEEEEEEGGTIVLGDGIEET